MRAVPPSPAPAALLLAGFLAATAGTGGAAIAPAQEPPGQEPATQAEAEASAPTGAASADDSPARQYDEDPAAQKRGSDLFRAVCTGYCHTTTVGADTDAPYLFDCDWDHGGSDARIFEVLSKGIPDTRMQGFAGKLPDADLWRIVSWVRMRSECKEAGTEGGAER
jgi:mono/diheme cytochrome c family protein